MAKSVQFLTNSQKLATRQRMRAKAVDAALQASARKWGETIKARAQALSHGRITAAQAAKYTPGLYSTARVARPVFDAIINQRSGVFAASWRLRVSSYSGHVTVTVFNVAPYSGFLDGTVKMRHRGVLEAARDPKLFTPQLRRAKNQAERTGGGIGSLALELVGVAVSVGTSYGGAAMEG